MEFIQLQVTASPIPLSQRVPGKTFPAVLDQVVARALSKRPEQRYASAAEFAAALQGVLGGGAFDSQPGQASTSPGTPHGALQVGPPVGATRAGSAGATPVIGPGRVRLGKTNLRLLAAVAIGFLALGVTLALVLAKYVIR